MSYFVEMSPAEIQFIRIYVAAMRRNYDNLRSVVELMNPEALGITDFYTATCAAKQLNEMQSEFEASLYELQKRYQLKSQNAKPTPTDEDLVDLFGLSFFKLVHTSKPSTPVQLTLPNGWFSGKPTEWKNSLKSYKDTPKTTAPINPVANVLSAYLEAFAKFFYLNNLSPPGPLPPGYGKKVWPTTQDDNFYEDDDDDDQTDDGPFDWLFDDNNDPD